MSQRDIDILQLAPDDDPVTLRDRLAFQHTRRVLLVWPRRGAVLRNKLDLLLVQRHATRQGIWIALVCADPVVVDHAREMNVSVYRSVAAARRSRWKRPDYKVFEPPAPRDPDAQAALAARVYRLRGGLALSPSTQRWRTIGRISAAITALVALIAGFFLAAPAATVTVTPASDPIYETITITGDPSLADVKIDTTARRIYAPIVQRTVSTSVNVAPSGEDSVRVPAEGTVILTNTSANPLVVDAGTVVSSPTARFGTLSEIVLQPGESLPAQVRALDGSVGTVGNVAPNTVTRLEGALAGAVTVNNPNRFAGGDVVVRPIARQEDFDLAYARGQDELLLQAETIDLPQDTGLARAQQLPVPGSVQMVEGTETSTFNPPVPDTYTTSVTLTMRARVRALVIDLNLAEPVVKAALTPQIPPGRRIATGSLDFTIDYISLPDPESGVFTFDVTVTGYSVVDIDEAYVRDRVTGVRISEARQRLQSELLLEPDIPPDFDLWPGWYPRMPLLPVRVNIIVEEP
ncbi:MAG: hypothetical protein GYB65_00250 [Chloroflexi bacterium]|nr:hypothetical protein [Chloroflexota bacterium]